MAVTLRHQQVRKFPMKRAPKALAARLATVRLDMGAGEGDFVNHLAQANHWPVDYTHRVCDEYKRFVALAALATQPVIPSDAIEQVWHLHVLHTVAYAHFCTHILPRPLAHTPSPRAPQNPKFQEWYRRTLDLYERAFDQPPPNDIWPSTAGRFAGSWIRLDTRSYFICPKPAWLVDAARQLKARLFDRKRDIPCAPHGPDGRH